MVLQAVEKRPSAVYSGPFTISRACQELLLIRRNGTLILARVKARGRLVAAYIVGNGLKPFPTRISGAPANGISQGSTCIWAFLISLKKMNPPGSLLRTPCLRRNASCRQANSSLRTCINNILYICLVVKRIVRVNFKSFIAL